MAEHRLLFSKNGTARYISHLDLMRTFQRAFARAGLPIRHTEGFNPHAFVSLPLPLSVGFSSDCELLEFGLLPPAAPGEVPERMNRALPAGIVVQDCYAANRPVKELAAVDYRIELDYPSGIPDGAAEEIRALLGQDSLLVDKKSNKAKSGFVEIDVIPHVKGFSITEEEGGLTLCTLLAAQNPGLNPQVLVVALVKQSPRLAPEHGRYHRQEILDAGGQVYR